MKIKVIDSFIFFNEFNMLKLRLNYLNEVVDNFIIVECNYTHSGKLKPYYLDEIINDIPENIRNKIIRLKYEPEISDFNFSNDEIDFNLDNDFWKLERQHRNFITENLSQFSPNDLFMLSDVDEIPNKESVKEYQEAFENYSNIVSNDFVSVLNCEMFYYNFNTFCGSGWFGTVFSTVGTAIKKTCDYLRYNRITFPNYDINGWHFSTFGDLNQIRTKIQSYAHQEYNRKEYTNDFNILNSIQNKEDIFHNAGKFNDYQFLNFPEDLRKLIVEIFPKELYQI